MQRKFPHGFVRSLPLVLLGSLPTRAANLFPDPGFEAWKGSEALPLAGKGHWRLPATGTNGFTVLERSTAGKHSGAAALHLKDDDGGPHNQQLRYVFDRKVVPELRGQVLRASCWIKVMSSSTDTKLGLELEAGNGPSKRVARHAISPVPFGTNRWISVTAKVRVPSDAVSASLSFNCAHGYYNTGEAYFDDVVVSADPADHPAPMPLSPSATPVHALTWNPPDADTPEEAAYRRGYREQAPRGEDGQKRPVIKDGNFWTDGDPQHFLGVWIYNKTRLDWPGNALKIDHFAYKEAPCRSVFDRMGFNSAQISAAHAQIGATLRGFPLLKPTKRWDTYDWRADEKAIAAYFRGFDDLPMVLDFAFGYHGRYPGDLHRLLEQHLEHWHAFIPFCPECPEGDRYYTDYFRGGTRAAMRHGCNVFMYELFNESSYGCGCRYNRAAFVERMRKTWGMIDVANARWGTDFDDWDELLVQSNFEQFPGVWYDWCRFLGVRYAEILTHYKNIIRSEDKRTNVYFTEQEAGHPATHPTMDYREIAKVLDAVTIEGGWQYGFKTAYVASNEMEAVVAAGGSEHFYNCDWFQALVRGRKPILNDEHYCVRLENGERAPSRKSDYKTSLWLEVMHGISANYTYVWDKRSWEARTPEQAHENVRKPSYKSSSLLNPWNVKPEDLSAFREWRDEFEPFRARVLPFPRVKPATVGVVFCKPTEIHKGHLPRIKPSHPVPSWVNPRDTIMPDWYAGILHALFPVRVVMAEDLAAEADGGLKALVFPDADCVEPETIEAARRFAARGGLVLASRTAFRFDGCFKPHVADLSFATRVEDVKAALRELMQADVPRYAALEPHDMPSKPIRRADVQICDRGDFKLVCLATMGEHAPRHVRLRLTGLDGQGPWRVRNPVTGTIFNRDGGWTPAMLADGIDLELPPQERVILVFDKPSAARVPGT